MSVLDITHLVSGLLTVTVVTSLLVGAYCAYRHFRCVYNYGFSPRPIRVLLLLSGVALMVSGFILCSLPC